MPDRPPRRPPRPVLPSAPDAREIKSLVDLMNEFGLVELEIEDKKGRVRLVRAVAADLGAVSASHAAPIPARAAGGGHGARSGAQATGADAQSAGAPESLGLAPNQHIVESPMVGTFYRAPAPDAAPFVEVGSSVRKGQTLCIIEAMKMMNEIEAPVAGRVVKIVIENGQPVQYGQALMVLEAG
ncbi:MAG TPA: acetyl-CoA carboxylase biotin carboxyl carrier protein [Candidatus Binataceae bacterium]|nr:acetyl-CoA carboxylase biotin carboxyl carrier protein [Candidatus Binataceae bacterium]